jgi:organic radical activating enzyme
MKQLNFDLSEKPPKISQYFISLEGEGQHIGQPSLYIRLAGCYSAACEFCDTKFSWGNAPGFKDIDDRDLTLDIVNQLQVIEPRRLTITGGEPLHFMNWFPDIFNWAYNMSPVGLDFIGIESNGNLLSKQENCIQLIYSFNEIIKQYGIVPALTISPKLDAKTCYSNKISQDEVNFMYFSAFQNISDYLQQYQVYYKFIFDYTNEHVDFEIEKQFIEFLTDELNVPKHKIMLMPFTPEDPLGKNKIVWEKSKDSTSRKALELGLVYSPRIHIDRRLD